MHRTPTRRRRALAVIWAAATAVAVVAVGAAGSGPATAAATPRSVGYSAYVQGRGWMPAVSNGATAGTVGRSLRVEAFKISGITLTYRAHVQKIGWQAWVRSGAVAGTVGRSLRVEAMQVKSLDPQWRVEYRANVQGAGWQRWVSDGATAGTTGRALRLEAMQVRLIERTPELTDTITFTATADNGLDTAAQGVFAGIGRSGANVGFVLGDLAYAADREAAYCSMVNSRVNFPTMLLAGNHEGDGVGNGLLSRFVACLPSRLGQVGTYAKDYYLDRGPVRFIMISPNITLSGALRTYRDGTPEQAWLRSTIRAARAASRWTVVGMHEPCLSLGVHGCASSPQLTDALIAEHVDLVLAGHDHDYTRTHQLAGTVTDPQVVDRDGTMTRGAGTVFAVVGNGGHAPRTVSPVTALYAAASGTNTPGGITFGFARVVVTADTLRYAHVRTSGGTLADAFTITASR